jgi:carboxylate-amine ligase
VNTHDYDLAPYSDEMLRLMAKIPLPGAVVPEMTSSMIEISTGVCHSCSEVLGQLSQIRDALVRCADKLNIACVGGGTHPFQQWHEQRIYDRPRFRQLSELYGYLSKQFTIFGQHVHVGCPDADSALLMLHRMSRYIPHFIALSASSPFVQGQDTQFDSARLNSVFAFPMSGRAPFTLQLGRVRPLVRQGHAHRRGQEHEGLLLGHPAEAGVRHDRDPRVRHAADRGTRRRPAGFVQSLASWFLRSSPSCRRKTTTWSTPTTASRPAASGWRRCTWSPPPASTCRCASTSR